MDYTPQVIDHFTHPRNVGEIPDADGIGAIGDPDCGDYMKVWIRVSKDFNLQQVTFKCKGCPAAIAAGSAITEMATGMNIDDASRITDADVAEYLGGLPAQKEHCSNLGAGALYRAIVNWITKP